ncbi:conserved hypothetical protein [Theileria orientalis strain Shintoku]|uniref:Uncharacterized protein n=1 Tax=Theileria orientalis strain Shintoku TaxID=869250 RepID=J4D6C6_THEOR|nr:conserved hypothetical protein [Theileria orientalis strain Shintoku]BAM39495.1 conserved hypothetical protein [Theileria orientalis strain Shintoku]|eukprot:XP_009689796.1 conserved hypothetical protein [Theileria orientalis strain Shintoku]
MFKFIFPQSRNTFHGLKYLSTTHRYYRTKYRKKVSIELNKPSIYEDRRTAPSKLLKANLFTPESAGYRELSMLCFWIVNYGYADYSILTRYVQCATDNIRKLKIKSIALIFHAVSKYLYDNDITLVESDKIEDPETENKNRQMLIGRCVQMIVNASQLMPNLFVNAVPKDLGMISLSIINIYQMFMNESDKNTKSQSENIKRINSIVNKLLQRLSQEIIPKLPFCELDEFAAYAKAFSKVNTDWSSHFMRELSHETSSLLMDKIEDLEMLARNKFVGEDLIEQLNKLPRDLATITCTLSKSNTSDTKFWERSGKVTSLLLKMKNKGYGIRELDITTLTLLCTSMSRHVDVRPIVEEMLSVLPSTKLESTVKNEVNSGILVGFSTSIRNLKDEVLAEKFLKKLNTKELINMNTRLVSQFIVTFGRSGLTGNTEVRDGIISLLDNELEGQMLTSIYISRKALNVPVNRVIELCKRLSASLNDVETTTLVSILMSSIDLVQTGCHSGTNNICDEVRSMCNQVIEVLSSRVDQIPLKMTLPLLSLVLNAFGGSTVLISRLCKKIDENFNDFDIVEMVSLTNEISSMGLNVNKLFSKNIMKIRGSVRVELGDDYIMSEKSNIDRDTVRTDTKIDFAERDETETAVIAKCTLAKGEGVNMLNIEDFEDEYEPENSFELTKYPSSGQKQELKGNAEDSIESRSLKAVSRSSTTEELKREWANLRQTVH